MQITGTDKTTKSPPHGVGRIAVEIGLSVGTGIVADQIRRSALRTGSASAALIGMAGGATVKALAKGAITAGQNLAADKPLTDGLADSLVSGLRSGAIDGAVTVAAAPLNRNLARIYPKMTVVQLGAASGFVLGGSAGLLETATNRRTWHQGVAAGLEAVGTAGFCGAVGGVILGGVTGRIANYLHARGAIKSITAVPESNVNSAVRGGLKTLSHLDRVQGSDIAGGGQPSILVDMQTPEILDLRAAAWAIGENTLLSKPDKINALHDLLNSKLRFAGVRTPEIFNVYTAVNRRYAGASVPIGEYVKAGTADCRGFAILNQILMQEAKVPTFYTYIQEFRNGRYIWDHAINVTFEGKTPVVVDALFRKTFDRMPLRDMLTSGREGVTFGAHTTLPYIFQQPAQNQRSLPGAMSALPHFWAGDVGAKAAVAREWHNIKEATL